MIEITEKPSLEARYDVLISPTQWRPMMRKSVQAGLAAPERGLSPTPADLADFSGIITDRGHCMTQSGVLVRWKRRVSRV